MQRILVDQANILNTTLEDVEPAAMLPGHARVVIDRFALTANNVTYAATGFVIGYWHFFPSGTEGKGQVPVWGFGRVVESDADCLEVGTRLYGFWPMAEELVIKPEAAGDTIVDAAEHRSKLPAVYNRYMKVPERDPAKEGLQALMQPLLATSYLLADWLSDNSFFEAEQIIVGSASSKTGLGLCAFLAELENSPVSVIGLTSAGNMDFVRDSGFCDQVVSYDDIETLATRPSVYVDMAGNAGVKARLHTHLADCLKHSSAVGTSHWDQFRPKQELAGPKPQFFFAPSQIEKRRADWGPGVIEHKIGEAWRRIAFGEQQWLDLKVHNGLAAAQDIYDTLAKGQASPRDGFVIDTGV